MKKKTNQLLAAALTAGSLLTGPIAEAGKPGVPASKIPRGKNVEVFALGCELPGYKSSIYTPICDEVTEAERCLALIKLSLMRSESKVDLAPVLEGVETEFAETCVETFREGLLGGEEQE